MSKYVVSLRRGYKIISSNGVTTRDDWVDYEKREDHVRPLEGELVIEYVNGIPRLKIGDGINEFSALPYMSVDSFILPKQVAVTLKANAWAQASDDRWYQTVVVQNATVTPTCKVDLYPNSEQLAIFHNKNLEFVAENNNGTISIFCVGAVPDSDHTILATITEVEASNLTGEGDKPIDGSFLDFTTLESFILA